jgi:two-component system chemotaxis response regulator CheB
MPGRDVVVVGGSAGGVEAMARLVAGLPADFPGALFFVLHLPAQASSALPTILARHGPLPAHHAVDGERVEPGQIYVAPPDHHLIVDRGVVRLGRGPRENRHRPSIDVLFRSAARAYGPRVVGVVLSGTLDDGTAGLATIKRLGGAAIVQDPEDALMPSMPMSALEHVEPEHTAAAADIPALLARLAAEPLPERGAPTVPDELEKESEIAELDPAALEGQRPGRPATFGCPDCGGTLWELEESGLMRFRCRSATPTRPSRSWPPRRSSSRTRSGRRCGRCARRSSCRAGWRGAPTRRGGASSGRASPSARPRPCGAPR